MTPPSRPAAPLLRRRRLFAVGAVLAAVVTLVFATLGDGVASDEPGLRGALIDYGHTLVWGLLTGALALAAVRGRWTRPCAVLATAALSVYALFLGALLL